jgi:hypothetical protein
VSVKIVGLDVLRRRLREVDTGLTASAAEAQRETAAEVVREWQARVPFDTGELHDSIRYDENGAYTDVPYARFVQTRAGQEAAALVGHDYERVSANRLRRALGRWARGR